MTFAHRNLDPKPPFGVAAPAGSAAVAAAKDAGTAEAPARVATLAPKTSRALQEIADFVQTAQRHAEGASPPDVTGLANAAPP